MRSATDSIRSAMLRMPERRARIAAARRPLSVALLPQRLVRVRQLVGDDQRRQQDQPRLADLADGFRELADLRVDILGETADARFLPVGAGERELAAVHLDDDLAHLSPPGRAADRAGRAPRPAAPPPFRRSPPSGPSAGRFGLRRRGFEPGDGGRKPRHRVVEFTHRGHIRKRRAASSTREASPSRAARLPPIASPPQCIRSYFCSARRLAGCGCPGNRPGHNVQQTSPT